MSLKEAFMNEEWSSYEVKNKLYTTMTTMINYHFNIKVLGTLLFFKKYSEISPMHCRS